METIILNSKSKRDIDLIAKVASKMGIEVRRISTGNEVKELNEKTMKSIKAAVEGKTTKAENVNDLLQKLNS